MSAREPESPLLLAAFVFHPGGAHVTGWRHPTSAPRQHHALRHYAHLADVAERGGFDVLFLADGLYVWDRYRSGVEHSASLRPEPFTVLSALSQTTTRLGLAATVSSTYNEPYAVARSVASLDHLSGGRAGWNLVTSRYDEEARNFGGATHADHARRYERAHEFVDVVEGLFDSWDDDAIVADAASGRFADPRRLHVLDHRGEHFTVRGPLNTARPPQGHPLLFQAGGSPAGLDLAAATADAVFARGGTVEAQVAATRDLRARTLAAGRDPRAVKVLPSVMPVVGGTRGEARALAQELLASTPDVLVLEAVEHTVGQSLAGARADQPFTYAPEGPAAIDTSNESKSASPVLARLRAQGRATPREVHAWSFEQVAVIGTGADVADHLGERVDAGAADGFVVQAPHLPGGLEAVTAEVVPELRRRGLLDALDAPRRALTLRERFGLARPSGR